MTTYTSEQVDALNPAELSAALMELAPQVLEAKAHYDALVKQQRQLVAAQALRGAGLRVGQRVQMRGERFGKIRPFALVAEPGNHLMFQVLKKDGTPQGDPQPEFMFQGWDTLD